MDTAGWIDNTALLNELLSQQKIAIEQNSFLEEAPQPLLRLDFDRVEGMLLGLAIGDALGNTTEGRFPGERGQAYGEIRDYLPNRYAGSRSVGLPSDDTQMAFWTLEQMLEDGGLVPDHLARRLSQEQIYGPGHTVQAFLRAYTQEYLTWDEAGQPSAGNGALMRIAPVILPHLRHPAGLWADAVLAGMITHNDRASNAACVSFVHLLWELLQMKSPPAQDWWLDVYVQVAAPLEGNTVYRPRQPGIQYAGPLWKFAAEQVPSALAQGLTVRQACDHWYSGAYLLETLPSVLFILARYGVDPEEALVRAVNDTWDNDTIAAIVGAAVGALHGKRGLPARWVENLLGRTGEKDDGRLFALIEQARLNFAA